MRYRWRELPALARTPVGRSQIRKRLWRGLWPILSRVTRFKRRTTDQRVVAVVGSFGKTTTTRAISAVLGLELPASSANAYTAIASRLLRRRAGQDITVVEVGITEPGQMDQYARVVLPDMTVVTAIGNTHQDRLRTLENTAHEKAYMVRVVPDTGLVVLNGDDPWVRTMANETGAQVVTFGQQADNDVRATDIRVEPPAGTRFTLWLDGSSHDVELRVLGEPAVYAALAAVAVGRAQGRSVEDMLASLANLPPGRGRLELARVAGIQLLRDDRKSSIDSVYRALDVLERVSARRRVVVLHEPEGEIRPDDVVFPPLGARLAEVADHVLFLGTAERFDALVRGADDGASARASWQGLGIDVIEATARLQDLLEAGDALLLKGPMTARLDRIILTLKGRTVRCEATFCDAIMECGDCPMLEPGWGNRPIVI